MIKEELLKKLALSIVVNGVDNKTANFILLRLNKTQLKTFLSYYKKAIAKESVTITTSEDLTLELQKKIQNIYSDKKLIQNVNPNLGAGIKIQLNDIIIDFTVKKYINDTIDQLEL